MESLLVLYVRACVRKRTLVHIHAQECAHVYLDLFSFCPILILVEGC